MSEPTIEQGGPIKQEPARASARMSRRRLLQTGVAVGSTVALEMAGISMASGGAETPTSTVTSTKTSTATSTPNPFATPLAEQADINATIQVANTRLAIEQDRANANITATAIQGKIDALRGTPSVTATPSETPTPDFKATAQASVTARAEKVSAQQTNVANVDLTSTAEAPIPTPNTAQRAQQTAVAKVTAAVEEKNLTEAQKKDIAAQNDIDSTLRERAEVVAKDAKEKEDRELRDLEERTKLTNVISGIAKAADKEARIRGVPEGLKGVGVGGAASVLVGGAEFVTKGAVHRGITAVLSAPFRLGWSALKSIRIGRGSASKTANTNTTPTTPTDTTGGGSTT